MVQIVLVRPGSTDYDVQGRIQGSLDIPLSERGLVEVAETAELLRDKGLEVIYSPRSQPPKQSAQAIAKALGIKAKLLSNLENVHLGLWEGMLVEEVRHKHPKVYRQWQEQPENVCPPEGEMLAEAEERVRAAIAKLLKRHKEGAVALVLSEPLRSLARRLLGHVPLGDLWKAPNGRPAVEAFEVEEGTFEVAADLARAV